MVAIGNDKQTQYPNGKIYKYSFYSSPLHFTRAGEYVYWK